VRSYLLRRIEYRGASNTTIELKPRRISGRSVHSSRARKIYNDNAKFGAAARSLFHRINLVIDRLAIIRLMSAVGAAKDQGAQTITICISSVGGSPEQAFYAYEILRALPIPLTTHNVVYCAVGSNGNIYGRINSVCNAALTFSPT
jgi:ATP-dependent protease ClpP protease subunit